jgi:3-hydroxybutyryl-CoA dehydratase
MTPAGTLQPLSLKVETPVIRAYAQLTDDFNPIHLDPQFAAATPMGGIIAHGTMSICLLWQMLYRSLGGSAFEALELDVRFVNPVREGEILTAGGTANAASPGLFDVWVRGPDGSDRVAGTLRVEVHPQQAGTDVHKR